MKLMRFVALALLFTVTLNVSSVFAQIGGARGYTRRIAPWLGPNQQQNSYYSPYANRQVLPPTPTPAPVPPQTAPPAVTPQPSDPSQITPAVPMFAPIYRRPVVPTDSGKSNALSDETVKKVVEFQKKRAEQGSSVAQYDLGVRYLKGDGVEKDEGIGRKWLEEAAKGGSTQAAKKLKELDDAKK